MEHDHHQPDCTNHDEVHIIYKFDDWIGSSVRYRTMASTITLALALASAPTTTTNTKKRTQNCTAPKQLSSKPKAQWAVHPTSTILLEFIKETFSFLSIIVLSHFQLFL